MGDTMAHDKLVCLIKGPNTLNNLCRNCDISFEETDNPVCTFKYTEINNLNNLIVGKIFSKVRAMGYYPLQNNPIMQLQYCDHEKGMNGSMFSEALYFIFLEYYIYAFTAFKNLRNNNNESAHFIFGVNFIDWANNRYRLIGLLLSRQSNKTFSRTFFPTGYIFKNNKNTNNTTGKKTGKELVGVVLVLFLFFIKSQKSTKNKK